VTGVEWTPITVDRLSHHPVHALVDIPDGTATLSAAEVAQRMAARDGSAGTQTPQRTTPLTLTLTGDAPTVGVARKGRF
jgi:hypothetical protein